MKILVTGGTGVVGAGALPELIKQGHSVRLLTRHARDDAEEYPEQVEPFPADVTKPETLRSAAEGCEAVIHITGIVEEKPPAITFDKINVEGTRNVLEEASRAGVKRFLFLSSLGAESGSSNYHQSKHRAEQLVRQYRGEWVILRPGNVYGPGDEVISMLLKMIRTLPVLPLVDDGRQPFQPIWFRDLGEAIAHALTSSAATNQALDLAGPDVTTTADILDKLAAITECDPKRLPLPAWVAQAGTFLAETLGLNSKAEAAGLPLPLNSAKLAMLLEGNVIQPPRQNALTRVLGVTPTTLNEGLTELADAIPELLPEDGVGGMKRKLFWADILGASTDASELIERVRKNLSEIMPIEFEAEPGSSNTADPGNTLTGAIPGRGHIQVRVEEATQNSFTLATLEGHPLAGTVTFKAEPTGEGVRFTVRIYARAANIFDWLALRVAGNPLQNQNWKEFVRRVVDLSGGTAPAGVQTSHEALSEEEAQAAEQRIRDMVAKRKRKEMAQA